MQGKQHKPITEAIPATSSPWPRSRTCTSATRSSNHADGPKLPALTFPTPMFGLAVEPKARGDEQKISGSLHKIADEDPTFKVTRDAQTKEMVITGMSQLHLDVLQHRLKRRFDLEIVTHEPKIPYRETIMTAGRGRASAQEADRAAAGQFGEVHLRVYPLPREIKSKEELLEQVRQQGASSRRCARPRHYDPDLQLRLHRPHRRRHHSQPVHAGRARRAARSCWSAAPWPATASRTWPSRSTSARTTTWTAPKRRSRPPAAWPSRRPSWTARPGAAGADRRAGGDGAVASTPAPSWAT